MSRQGRRDFGRIGAIAAHPAAASAIGLFLLALAGGCSSTEEILAARPQPAPSASPSSSSPSPAPSPSFTDRFRNLFGSSEKAGAAQTTASSAAQPGSSDTTKVNCPPTDIRQGAATLQMSAPGSDGALAVRYQATFGRTARQCAVNAGTLTIKVGVQGRLILGPAGAPGETHVPLRYALVQEGLQPKTIWSKLYMLPVSITADQPSVPFTHVMEDLAVPLPPGDELDRYVIYIGFDPQGAEQEKGQQRRPQRGAKPRSG
jgi:hypothetical protein